MGKSSAIHSPASDHSPSMGSSSWKRQYKGVRRRSWGSWVSEIRAPHQKTRIWLGSYSSPEAAARAYDAALLCLKGSSSSASLNFPASLPPHHLPSTAMSPKSIQKVAAAAAANATVVGSFAPPPPPSSPSQSMDANEGHHPIMDDESWTEVGTFQSPKFMDENEMISPLIYSGEECEETGVFDLWSFF